MVSKHRRVLVTGGSSGIGAALVDALLASGETVIATTRKPEQQVERTNLQWLALDLNDPDSVTALLDHPIWETPLDAVVNNAGYGLIAPIESAAMDAVRDQFEANFFATIAMTQHAMAHFRTYQQGTLMVVTSIGGRMAFPYFGYYNATKHALEAVYEALWYECIGSGIRVRIIEPGFTQTQFATHGMQTSGTDDPIHTQGLQWLSNAMKSGTTATPPAVIGQVMKSALECTSDQLRFAAGKHAGTLLTARKILPDRWFSSLIAKAVMRGQKAG